MIPGLSSAALTLSGSPELLLLAKATVILTLALIVSRIAARSRASARHVVMATAFAALIALPVLMASVPPVAFEVAAARPTAPAIAEPAVLPGTPEAERSTAPAPAATAQRSWSTLQWLRAIWIAGAIAFLIPVASALWRLSMIRRTGLPVAWHRAELARLADARGVSLPVELLEHEAVPGPMTFGISKPVIVLPLDAREWSEAELRRALMHEIEHIQRGDWLMHILARSVAAFYWFHPMVWTAWRRLCLEAERSCDDAVVISEERTDYAEQLVSLAQRMSATPVQPMLGMANRSDLSTRVTAVLDERMRRGRTGFTLAAGTVAAAAVMVLTMAPVRAIAKPQDDAAAAQAQLRDKIEMVDAAQQRKRRADDNRRVRAIDRALYEAANEGAFEEVKELVMAGANPSARVDGDGSPLIGAARSGRADIMRYLLEQGADPNGTVDGDGSPLIAAAQRGRLELAQMLIDRGADVNLAVEGDENPLMNAAEVGSLPIVQLLVSRGADVHTRIWTEKYEGGGEWRTAIGQARKNGHRDVVQYLESRGARD